MSLLGIFTAALTAVTSAGCGGSEGETACTDIAVFSVNITVYDLSGAVAGDAAVRFRVDGGPWSDAQCFATEPGDACSSWAAGIEQAGMFEIEADSADGSRQAQAAVEVLDGECHVEAEQVALTLE